MEKDGDGEMERDGDRRWTNKPLEANHRIGIGFATVSALEVLSKGNSVVVRVVELDVCEDLRERDFSREFSFLFLFIFHFSGYHGQSTVGIPHFVQLRLEGTRTVVWCMKFPFLVQVIGGPSHGEMLLHVVYESVHDLAFGSGPSVKVLCRAEESNGRLEGRKQS